MCSRSDSCGYGSAHSDGTLEQAAAGTACEHDDESKVLLEVKAASVGLVVAVGKSWTAVQSGKVPAGAVLAEHNTGTAT